MKSNIAVVLVLAVTSMVVFISLRDTLKPRTYLQRAEKLLDEHMLIDGHNDVAYMIRENFQNKFDSFDFNDLRQYVSGGGSRGLNGTNGVTHTDMIRLRQGKLRGQFWASFAFCNSLAKDATRIHLEQVDTVKRLIRKHSAHLEFVTDSIGLIKAATKNNKIASMIGLESGHAIDSSLSILRVFYDLGVRYMTLTHNCDVPWATNNLADLEVNNTRGLTQFGRRVIREMNRLGMIVDLSHTSYQTQLDALNETKAPLMFSHSSIYSLCNHTRNVRDDVLLKLKENNGIVMINFYNEFLTCGLKANLSDVVDHVNYVKEKIGADHVGIGSDFDGVPLTPRGLEDVSKYPELFAELLRTGWSQQDLAKLAGRNLIRVLQDVEKYSESVKETMEPLDDYISQQDLGEEYKSCRTSF